MSSHRCGTRSFFVAATVAVLSSLLGCGSPSPLDGTAVPPAAAALVQIDADTLPASQPLSVQVPSIGVRTGELIDLGLTAERELEVPDDAVTAGWFELSPTPGEVGPAVIAGHVDYAGVPGVFGRLRDVQPGDEISVARVDETTAVFTVYEVQRYPKSEFPTDRVYGNTEMPELRLITCGGAFDEASGNYLDNVIVYGRMTSAHRQ
ncbi:MAG: class F sortase [Actinomycetota bacterium]|nr:class F sortase [Actinomycetota bacterium]